MKTEDVVVGFSVNPSIVWNNVPSLKPGEKIAANYYVEPSGTSLDVALAVQRAGFRPHLVGAVGPSGDPFNGYLSHAIGALGVPSTLLPLRSQNALANVEPEHGRALSAKPPIMDFDAVAIRRQLDAISATVRVATGVMPDDNELELVRILLGNEARVRVLNPRQALLADPDRFAFALAYANWLVLNQHEANQVGEAELVRLVHEGKLDVLVVTKDEQGVALWTKEEGNLQMPAFPAGTAIHTVGAGDCFLGYFIAGWLEKLSWVEALRLAVVAAGIKTTMPGTTSSPTRDVVDARLHEFPIHTNVRRR